MRVSEQVMLVAAGVLLACGGTSGGDDDSGGAGSGGTAGSGGGSGTATLESRCMSVCEGAQTADCSSRESSTFDHPGCIGACTRISDMKADTDMCYAEATTLVNCLDGLSDVCNGFEIDPGDGKLKGCNSEAESYSRCVADYCADHQTQDYCS